MRGFDSAGFTVVGVTCERPRAPSSTAISRERKMVFPPTSFAMIWSIVGPGITMLVPSCLSGPPARKPAGPEEWAPMLGALTAMPETTVTCSRMEASGWSCSESV